MKPSVNIPKAQFRVLNERYPLSPTAQICPDSMKSSLLPSAKEVTQSTVVIKGALPWCLSSTIIHLPMQVLGRSPGEGNDNLLQYSCLENPLGRGAYSPRRGKQLDVTQ